MDSGKWLTAGLLITLLSLTASQLDGDEQPTETIVMVGERVDLECGDNSPVNNRRIWKRGDEIWLIVDDVMVNDDRVSSVNRSSIMRLVNVTLDDEGYYTCTVYTQPQYTRTVHLQVIEMSCKSPEKPANGDYESKNNGDTHRIGDSIRYYCNSGYKLVGQSNRICTGTLKGWGPDEPYCQPEYIDFLLQNLDDIETKVSAIEQRITTVENNTSEMGNKMSEIDKKVSLMDNRMSTMNKTSANTESRLATVGVSVSMLESVNSNATRSRARLVNCTNITKGIDQDTVFKCMTMQLGMRNGRTVSQYKWVIHNYMNKVPQSDSTPHDSPPFYQTIPGYKLRLRGSIHWDTDIYIYLSLLPGEYDDQLTWPFSKHYDLTVVMKNGTEVLHKSFSGDRATCHTSRPTSASDFSCFTVYPNWQDVWKNKAHILDDGAVVIKLYLYN